VAEFDAIVVGLGAVGSAATYQLTKRGARVLGLDQFDPPHDLGSSHGQTRITRLAIGEGEHYTPLAIRSHEIWREIERETGADLLTTNGGLVISSRNKTSVMHVDAFYPNTVSAARRHGIAHELLDAAEIRRRWPVFAVADDEFGYFEPSAGFLRPEACIEATLGLARKRGAALHTTERALSFEQNAGKVTVRTDKGCHTTDQLIVSAGAWLPQLLGPDYARLFTVYRQMLCWFAPKGDIAPFLPERFPIFIWELRTGRQGVYGFPALDGAQGGVKVATEHYESATTPQSVRREVSAEEISAMYESVVRPCLPGLSPRCVRFVTCLYTVTPDFGFVIDRLPEASRVIVASPCSGHGFKHSPALGEALAELVTQGRSALDLASFSLGRFRT